MGQTVKWPQIGVLDECDAPEAKMLVLIWGDPDHPNIQYISPTRHPIVSREKKTGFPSQFKPAALFGVTLRMTELGDLLVQQKGASVATYRDGIHRPWQGVVSQEIQIRPQIAGAVIKAVKAGGLAENGPARGDATEEFLDNRKMRLAAKRLAADV